LISRDIGVTANLLRIVNSAFFGLPRRVTSIEAAINYLGTTMLRSIVLANAAVGALGPRARKFGYDLQGHETHALLSAHLAMQFFSEKHAREDAFTAGLLQNLGELLLVASAPENALTAFHQAKAKGTTLDAEERELGVVSHAQLGAYLLGAWGLPFGIVEVVAHHHQPDAIAHDALEIVDAVYVASLVADHCLSQRPEALSLAGARLAAFGASDMLETCMSNARRCLRQEDPAP
jgi:HD-like signal output (HDOD) protein